MIKETIQYIKTPLGIGHKLSFNQDIPDTLDEIIFENREKEYGAYVLRKNYSWHLITAVGLVTSAFLYLSFLPVFFGWFNKNESNEKKTRIPYCPVYPYPEGYATPQLGKMISIAELQKIKQQIHFRIPKPAPPEELYIDIGKDKINTTPNPAKALSYSSIADHHFPLGNRDYLDSLELFFEYEEEIIQVCDFPEEREEVILEKEPRIIACYFGDEESSPINLNQIIDCIDLPKNQNTGSSNFLFSILIKKNGNYGDHRIIQGKNQRIIQKLENCIEQLKFTPAIRGGKPVETWVNLPIRVDYVE